MKKRFMALMMAIMIVASIIIVPGKEVNAASYPLLVPREFYVTVTEGETAEVVYDYFPEYKNEEVTVEVYNSAGVMVASCERSFYNTSSMLQQYTVTWDTTGKPAGKYKVVASTRFYSLYRWNSSPNPTVSYITVKERPTTVYNGVDYSVVYDFEQYINKYQDIKMLYEYQPSKALEHFVNYGMREGRIAKSTFDVKSYRNKYQDLRIAYGKDWKKYYEHYIKYGYREGRKATGVNTLQNPLTKLNGTDYSAVYDYNYYISHNADVKKAFGDDDVAVLKHFVNNGMREGRQGKATFELKSYRNAYGDLRAAFGNNNKDYYMHYIKYGAREKRVATGVKELRNAVTVYNGVDYSKVYNYNYYIKKYPDIKKAFGSDDAAVLRHFVNYGMREGRQGAATFNLAAYRSRYSDLRAAFGKDNAKYYMHYIRYGYREKRKAN